MQQESLTERVGAGPVTSEVNEHRGAGIKTRDGHAFALKGYSSLLFILELSVLHSSVRVAHEEDKRNNQNSTKKRQCRDRFVRKASRR